MWNTIINRLTLVAVSASLCSCSIIGLGLGSLQDAKDPKLTPVSMRQLKGLSIGEDIRVFTSPSDSIEGEFRGIVLRDHAEYSQRFSKAKALLANESIWLPNIGDTATVLFREGTSPKFCFLGIDEGGAVLASQITNNKMTQTYRLWLTSLDTLIDATGHSLDSTSLNFVVSKRAVPYPSVLVIQTRAKKDSIALEHVTKLECINSRNMKLVGLAVGVFVDGLVIVGLAALRLDMDTRVR